MFGTFVKATFQHTYDAILAAPVDTEEIVTAEALWMATRAGTYGCIPMLVAIAFGLDPAIDMLTVPFIAFLAGFGWACFGIMISGLMKSFENFNYVVSGVLTPMMLTAGTFFPLTTLPQWAQVLGNFNPLHHCVELVRHAAFGWDPGERPPAPRRARLLRGRDVAHRRLGDDPQARDLALLLGRAGPAPR